MRVREERFIEHTGTMAPKKVQEMEFDENSIAHLMSVLTDLYSDQALAVIREYSTNGLDSHRASGNTAPIEVELPSQLKPTFVVRDFGIGMSVDDITDHFSKYGASSKRDTDEEVGMLGLGCKSGLTYTNQFTLTAVKNGVKTTALVTRNEEGKGVIQIMDTIGTNEPNGVEIQIPVKAPIHEFVRKAQQFFSFWEPGTVLVNSAEPKSHFDGENEENLFLDPDIIVVKAGLDRDYVVMGNVAYPVHFELPYRTKVIARVGIGEVNFVTSPEALQMTKRTVDAIAEIKKFVQDRLELHIQREINACNTKAEAIKVAVRWDGLVHNYRKRPTYRGDIIPNSLEMNGQSWNCGFYRGSAQNTSYLRVEDLVQEGVYVMLGHPPRSMTKETKEEIRKVYPNSKQVYVVHSMKREFRVWLDAGQIFHFDDVRPAKQPRVKGQRAANFRYADGGGRWLCWTGGVKFETLDIPADTDRRIVWITKTEFGWGDNTRDEYRKKMGEFLSSLADPFYLVLLSTQEVEKFHKACPGAIHGSDFFQTYADQIRTELTDDQFWWGERNDWRLNLPADQILDPVSVALYARMADCLTPKAMRLNKELTAVCGASHRIVGGPVMFGNHQLMDARRAVRQTLESAMQEETRRYPLASHHQIEKTVEYMNAVWLYRKKQKTPNRKGEIK